MITDWRVWLAKQLLDETLSDIQAADIVGRHPQITPLRSKGESFQARVAPWMGECFGAEISNDRLERGDRLVEEVYEALQWAGYPPERLATLQGYVWGRPVGEGFQEVGGVMVTLAAFCLAHGLDMHDAGETELARVWTKVEQIRAKQASKRGLHTPLPVPPKPEATQTIGVVTFEDWCDALDRIAASEGYGANLTKLTGRDAWRDYFDDGCSPEGALREDESCDA